jgi:hypothetical protein
MTENEVENQVQTTDKELNFRKLEAKYQEELSKERAARMEAERKIQESVQKQEIEEEDSDPYVDHKKLNKTLSKFGQTTQSEINKAMEIAKRTAKEELKREMWIENNPDFYEVLNKHAEKFAQRSPKLAETILKMPEGFERQQLVYQNIKELGIDKPEQPQSSIQDKIDANRRSPFYQPSGVAASPYGARGDYSEGGQKQAYDKMKELQARLRLQ